MIVYAMMNDRGIKSANNFIIQNNAGIKFMQSYNEIVAIEIDRVVYINKVALDRSITTSKYINIFSADKPVEVLMEHEFKKLLEKLG